MSARHNPRAVGVRAGTLTRRRTRDPRLLRRVLRPNLRRLWRCRPSHVHGLTDRTIQFLMGREKERVSLLSTHPLLLFKRLSTTQGNSNGAPGATLTRDLPLRRRTLYTTELREHIVTNLADALVSSPARQD